MNQERFYTDTQDSWNCIVAYIYPEKDRRNLAKLMKQLKKRAGVSESNEVKLKEALNNLSFRAQREIAEGVPSATRDLYGKISPCGRDRDFSRWSK